MRPKANKDSKANILASAVLQISKSLKGNSKFFTVEFETPTGGSILNHFMFGEKKDKLVYRANMRCKKINTESKAVNFRLTFQGNIITDERSLFEYDCK